MTEEEIITHFAAETIYIPPSIRKQTFEEAEAHLSQKRTRRLVAVHKHKQSLSEKATKHAIRDMAKFTKRQERFERAIARAQEEINKAEKYLAEMYETDHAISNSEQLL